MNTYEKNRQYNIPYETGYTEGFDDANYNNIDSETLSNMLESEARREGEIAYKQGFEDGQNTIKGY